MVSKTFENYILSLYKPCREQKLGFKICEVWSNFVTYFLTSTNTRICADLISKFDNTPNCNI